MTSLLVENPIGSRLTRVIKPAPRMPLAAGSRVSILSNSKPNADELLEELLRELRIHYAVEPGMILRKRDIVGSAGYATPSDVLDRLAAQSEAVVTASGDCGGCTSWSLVDSIELEKRGMRTALICTDIFRDVAVAEAQAADMPGFPEVGLALIPHPLAGLSRAQVADRASIVAPTVATLLGLVERNH